MDFREKRPIASSRFNDDHPLKSEIVEHWKERLLELGFLAHWGRPRCWACGFHYGGKYDTKRFDAGWDKILSCWNKIPLQRCHVIPKCLGGTDDAPNRFLMCRECHDLAPNTSIPEIFFEWAIAQDWDTRESAKIYAALNAFDVDDAAQPALAELIISEEFKSWMRGKFGLHRPQSNYAPISCRLTPATLVGLAVHYRSVSKAS
jgi:hypothetical protein